MRIWKSPFRKDHHAVEVKQFTKNMATGDLYLGVSYIETLVEVMWLIAFLDIDI